jgi:RNA-directed DNA polymerase
MEQEAQAIKAAMARRFAECGLEMHPDKTRIVYCKDSKRRGQYTNTKFDFQGASKRQPHPFVHWQPGMVGMLA